MTVTAASLALRENIAAHRDEFDGVLRRYRARNPRLFGSVSRGDATAASDIDVLVDLEPDGGNELLRIAGLGEELSQVLDTRVDVVTPSLLRTRVSETARADAVALWRDPRTSASLTS